MMTIRYSRKPTFANVWADRLTEARDFPTANGTQTGQPGDYVIDPGGEPGTSTAPYPCPADVFERTYQLAE